MPSLIGKTIGKTGFGLMGFTWRPQPVPTEQAIETMHEALKHGANFWNGGVFYGTPESNSLQLLAKYFEKYPEDADKVVLSIKGGNDPVTIAPQGDEASICRDIDFCLKTLGDRKKLDIFEASRVDPKVPIEDTLSYIKKYVDEGKIGGISISEVGESSIRKAAKFTKIVAVEIEFSLFSTEPMHNGIFKACAELGIPVVAYSPLGRGFLTGQLKSPDDIPEGDLRKIIIPRFFPENFDKNLELVHEVEKLAKTKGCTPGQIALSWVEQQSGKDGNPTIIPIPGTTSKERLAENMVRVELNEEDFEAINELISKIPIVGERYCGHAAKVMDG